MTCRIHVTTDRKYKPPDWPIQPHVPRSADEYEKYNTKKPEPKS